VSSMLIFLQGKKYHYAQKKKSLYVEIVKILGNRYDIKQIADKLRQLEKQYKKVRDERKKTGWGVDDDSDTIEGNLFTILQIKKYHLKYLTLLTFRED
jgi:hypothetical protein